MSKEHDILMEELEYNKKRIDEMDKTDEHRLLLQYKNFGMIEFAHNIDLIEVCEFIKLCDKYFHYN